MPLVSTHLVLTHSPRAPSGDSGWSKASKAGLSLPSWWKRRFLSYKPLIGPQRPSSQWVTPCLEHASRTLSSQTAWNSHSSITGLDLEGGPSPSQTPPPTHHIPIIGTSGLGEGRVRTHQWPGTPSLGQPTQWPHNTNSQKDPSSDDTTHCSQRRITQQVDLTELVGSAKWRHLKT